MTTKTKLIIQQVVSLDSNPILASKYPRYTILLANSISSITAAELDKSIQAAADSAASALASKNAAKVSQDAAKTSETNAKTSETAAKASQDAAKTSETNAKASEIAAANSVNDVINAITNSSLPLPDVWVPFSNDLIMLTGYGDEVKVAGITVANLVTFSRSTTATYISKSGELKIADINEPRFEKNGLLIEGQSTNLCQASTLTTKHWALNPPAILEPLGFYTKITPGAPGAGAYINPASNLIVGNVYTFSFWAYSLSPTCKVAISMEKENKAIYTITSVPTRYSITFTATQQRPTIISYGGYDGFINEPGAFFVGGFQLEEYPVMSSLIPTDGTQVTRSQDNCLIGYLNNAPPMNNDITVSIQTDLKSFTNRTTPTFVGMSPSPFNPTAYNLRATLEPSGSISVWAGMRHDFDKGKILPSNILAFSVRGDESIAMLNGEIKKLVKSRDTVGHCIGFQTGHIKNLRIWHQALTDEQLKALK